MEKSQDNGIQSESCAVLMKSKETLDKEYNLKIASLLKHM